MTHYDETSGDEKTIIACNVCSKLHYCEKSFKDTVKCVRCGSRIYKRKKDSAQKTWAFLIAALIFYIPANIYPIMTFSAFGKTRGDTIISGVNAFIKSGLWPLAFIVFTASIFVPLAKIFGLMFILCSIKFKWDLFYKERTKLYFIVEFIGKWSMLDVFLISLLTSIVSLGNIASVTPGPGITYFAFVVILTLFAAMSFDPRLIWDNNNKNER
ncbi:MAG: paraquat-inducible protein A [Desulfobacteraceae bacterium]|nr:paraquat-inducible protein A [Desulfobacteraceae bacterium]